MANIETEAPLDHEDKLSSNCCGECGSENIISDPETGERICSECGLVFKNIEFDSGPEWRAFNIEEEKKRKRTGSPISLTIHDQGLSTTIGRIDKDSRGNSLNAEKQLQMLRLRKWNRRSKVTKSFERNLVNALPELNNYIKTLNLPQIAEEQAAYYYRDALKKELIRGRTINTVVAASIYAACRTLGIVRSLEQVAETANIKKREVATVYRFLLRKGIFEIERDTALKRLPTYVNKLNLSGITQKYTQEILETCEEEKMTSGNSPAGLCAAAIYIGCTMMNEYKTQGEISEATGVTEVTIRNRYKDMIENLDFLIHL